MGAQMDKSSQMGGSQTGAGRPADRNPHTEAQPRDRIAAGQQQGSQPAPMQMGTPQFTDWASI